MTLATPAHSPRPPLDEATRAWRGPPIRTQTSLGPQNPFRVRTDKPKPGEWRDRFPRAASSEFASFASASAILNRATFTVSIWSKMCLQHIFVVSMWSFATRHISCSHHSSCLRYFYGALSDRLAIGNPSPRALLGPVLLGSPRLVPASLGTRTIFRRRNAFSKTGLRLHAC